ncbi:MAG: hypothetical protein HQ481_15160 [Alphaproteobacteria bacterium]|nr:hypothetical protein [Alphaproteobacteria bacterium]
MTGDETDGGDKPVRSADMLRQRRGKNIALLSVIMALAALFFVITILRMS